MSVTTFTVGHGSLLRAIAAHCERRFAAGESDEQVVAAIARETGVDRGLIGELVARCRAWHARPEDPTASTGRVEPLRRGGAVRRLSWLALASILLVAALGGYVGGAIAPVTAALAVAGASVSIALAVRPRPTRAAAA